MQIEFIICLSRYPSRWVRISKKLWRKIIRLVFFFWYLFYSLGTSTRHLNLYSPTLAQAFAQWGRGIMIWVRWTKIGPSGHEQWRSSSSSIVRVYVSSGNIWNNYQVKLTDRYPLGASDQCQQVPDNKPKSMVHWYSGQWYMHIRYVRKAL